MMGRQSSLEEFKAETYQKLRPWTEIESCECASVNGLFLVYMYTDNPIHCDFCRKEVDPERINLTTEETSKVVGWIRDASALQQLWLNSGEYEEYAKAKLIDPTGEVNRKGIAAAELLSNKIPTLLWYFYDTDDGEPTNCPVCGGQLNLDVKWGTGQCSTCRIQI